MANSKITRILINNEDYQIGDEAAFILTENNGAKMSTCTSTGQYAVAEGLETTASGDYSHAEGSATTASGTYSHAEGRGTIASSVFCHAEGNGTTASGTYSHAEGANTTAATSSSHAEGDCTLAKGVSSHAEGYSTTADGFVSHAEGSATTANGSYSHAEGLWTSATTKSEHASGQFNISLSGSNTWGDSGNTLFTVGNGYSANTSTIFTHNALQIMQDGTIYIVDTSGEGQYYEKPMIKLQDELKNSGGGSNGGDSPFILTEKSGATMSACTSTGDYAVAEGSGTTAGGSYSHAEGKNTKASGTFSHAEGEDTTASGAWSHVEGDYTSAKNICEHASGRHNRSLSGSTTFGDSGNTLFTVGNGNTTVYPHNALQIMQSGDIYISDTNAEGEYCQKPMIKLQDLINRISELETKVAVLESNEVTKTEVIKGFNNVITVVDNNKLKIRNNALEDE